MKLLALLQSSPDAAVLLAAFGVLLIYVELNRPGLIVPGAVGTLAILLAAAALKAAKPNVPALLLISASVTVQIVSLRRHILVAGAALAGIGMTVGCLVLFSRAAAVRVHLPEAMLAGMLLGPGTSILTAIARRARTNKGLDL